MKAEQLRMAKEEEDRRKKLIEKFQGSLENITKQLGNTFYIHDVYKEKINLRQTPFFVCLLRFIERNSTNLDPQGLKCPVRHIRL